MKTVTAVSAAILAASVGFAYAQGTGGTTQTRNQCWDVATNTVKNQAPGSGLSGTKQGGTTGSAASGSTSPGSSTSGSAASGTSSGGTGPSTASRPAGMPNC